MTDKKDITEQKNNKKQLIEKLNHIGLCNNIIYSDLRYVVIITCKEQRHIVSKLLIDDEIDL